MLSPQPPHPRRSHPRLDYLRQFISAPRIDPKQLSCENSYPVAQELLEVSLAQLKRELEEAANAKGPFILSLRLTVKTPLRKIIVPLTQRAYDELGLVLEEEIVAPAKQRLPVINFYRDRGLLFLSKEQSLLHQIPTPDALSDRLRERLLENRDFLGDLRRHALLFSIVRKVFKGELLSEKATWSQPMFEPIRRALCAVFSNAPTAHPLSIQGIYVEGLAHLVAYFLEKRLVHQQEYDAAYCRWVKTQTVLGFNPFSEGPRRKYQLNLSKLRAAYATPLSAAVLPDFR